MVNIKEIKKKKIAVIYGGESSEREVSIRSAENIYKVFIQKGYNAVKINLDKNISENLKKEKIDFAYIIVHGCPGEDGTIQGLLEIMKIPYTGSGVLGSAIAINKIVTKQLLIANNIMTPAFYVIRGEWNSRDLINLGFPLIFKPYSEGSSIGIIKINSEEELKKALPDLLKKYKIGIIEKFITGKDITIGVLDIDNKTQALPILQLASKNEFYDYDAKYTKGKTKFIIPAQLNDELTQRAKDIAIRAYNALWCWGVSRVDMIVCENNDIFVLEVNTIPGMTDISDLPAEAKEMGIEFSDLVETILISGYTRYDKTEE